MHEAPSKYLAGAIFNKKAEWLVRLYVCIPYAHRVSIRYRVIVVTMITSTLSKKYIAFLDIDIGRTLAGIHAARKRQDDGLVVFSHVLRPTVYGAGPSWRGRRRG